VRCHGSEDKPMDAKLSEQIQAVIDTVAVAGAQMADLAETVNRISGDSGPEYHHIQHEIARILDELSYMRYIAVLREAEQATSYKPNKSSLN
jgi:hypothetical protein